MPLPFLFPAAVVLGMCHALFAERALRHAGQERMLFAAALFGAAIVLPVEAYLLHDYADWAYLYLLEPRRIPSAIDLILLLLAAATVPAAAWLGARWLAQDTKYRVLRTVLGLGTSSLVVGLIAWRRLTHFGTHAQYTGNYGLRSLTECSLGPSLLLVVATLAAGLAVSARALRR